MILRLSRLAPIALIVSVLMWVGLSMVQRVNAWPIFMANNEISTDIDLPCYAPPGIPCLINEDHLQNGISLSVKARVVSLYEVDHVFAQIETLTTTLIYSPTAGGFVGSIPLLSLSHGIKTVMVTAVDIFGNSHLAHVDFDWDRKPVVHVIAPEDYSVGRPNLNVSAWCTDDDPAGCRAIDVTDGCSGNTLVHAQNTISQVLSLANYEGRALSLCFKGTDWAGQQAGALRLLYVDSSPLLIETEHIDGEIIDLSATRILYAQYAVGKATLKVRDYQSGQDVTIATDLYLESAHLTPYGVLYVDGLQSWLYEWRDGLLISLGHIDPVFWFEVAGDYLLWNDGAQLFRRNLALSSTLQIADNAGNVYNDVAANGDVVYWTDATTVTQIMRYRDGITVSLTNDIAYNFYPATDGLNVVYSSRNLTDQTCSTELIGPTNERSTLVADCPNVNGAYRLNNGWIAFTKAGNTGQLQIWRRAPLGGVDKLGFFGINSFIDSLGPNGEVVFTDYRRSYLSRPAHDLIDISSGAGRTYWIDDQLVKTIGRSVFQVLHPVGYLPIVAR